MIVIGPLEFARESSVIVLLGAKMEFSGCGLSFRRVIY